MLRSGLVAFLLASAASAGIWIPTPERTVRSGEITSNRPLWDEYGMLAVEETQFGDCKAVAYQFRDTTGAYAAFDWLRGTDRSAKLEGNILVTSVGVCPTAKEWMRFIEPNQVSNAVYTTLPSYLPSKGLVADSERYILGPVSLAEFAPSLPPAAVALQFSTEAVVAHYRSAKGDLMLAVVSYPTPAIARQQAEEFRKLSRTLVKRSGPLVLVIPFAKDQENAANDLVSGIDYQVSVSWDEKPPDPRFMTKLKDMLWAIGELILFILALCLVGGFAVGGVRAIRERFGNSTAGDEVIILHLADK